MRPATCSMVGHCDSGVSICVREEKHTDSMLTIILVDAKHSNVSGYPWRQRSLAVWHDGEKGVAWTISGWRK
jgi:hypothetical protein